MTNNYLFDHLRPTTLVQLIAELIDDHADIDDTGEITFCTEAAKNAYAELLAAGRALMGEDEFNDLLEKSLN